MEIGQVQGGCGCQGSGSAGASPIGALQELMKNLSSEDRVELQSAMQELSQDERMNIMDEFSKLDTTALNSEDLFSSLMSIVSSVNKEKDTNLSNIEIYA